MLNNMKGNHPVESSALQNVINKRNRRLVSKTLRVWGHRDHYQNTVRHFSLILKTNLHLARQLHAQSIPITGCIGFEGMRISKLNYLYSSPPLQSTNYHSPLREKECLYHHHHHHAQQCRMHLSTPDCHLSNILSHFSSPNHTTVTMPITKSGNVLIQLNDRFKILQQGQALNLLQIRELAERGIGSRTCEPAMSLNLGGELYNSSSINLENRKSV